MNLRDSRAPMGALCRWWNRSHPGADRSKTARFIMRSNTRAYFRGRGNKARRRARSR